MTYRRAAWVAAATVSLMVFATPALAHVSVETTDPAPQAVAKYTMRVPNESDTADTVKIEVQLPQGAGARPRAAKGWDIEIEDGVLILSGGRIGPGDSETFVFRMQNPARPGDVTFPVIQTYSDGVEAAWVGAAGSDHPAPVVSIAGKPNPPPPPKQRPDQASAETTSEPVEGGTPSPAASESVAQPSDPAQPETSRTPRTVTVVAGLVVAGLGLGAYALARRSRTR